MARVLCTFVVVCVFWSLSTVSSSSPKRPNIILLLADDMGYGDMGKYSDLYPHHGEHGSAFKLLTPRLDALADQGMLFTDAYAGAPVCAPSRCTLMTGKHSGHCTMRSNEASAPYKLNPDSLGDITVARVLKDAGYDTAMFGKWGLGDHEFEIDGNVSSISADPVSKGFDTYVGQTSQLNCYNYYPSEQWEQQKEVAIPNNVNASFEKCGGARSLDNCEWTGDLWTDDALDYLSEPARDEKPFFLFMSYTTPHAGDVGETDHDGGIPVPAVAESPYYAAYLNGTIESFVELQYAASITALDTLVGEILDTLEETGHANNTVVFFASDNGAHNSGYFNGTKHNYRYFASSGPFDGCKGNLKEGGIRVPLVIRWPHVIEAGSVSEQQWSFYDFMATVAEIANVSSEALPENDGYSLVPTLKGETQAQREYVYHEFCKPRENKHGWGQALRMGDFSGLCIGDIPSNSSLMSIPNCDEDSFELYDLSTDIHQTNNIAADYIDVVREMMQIMEEQHDTWDHCQNQTTSFTEIVDYNQQRPL